MILQCPKCQARHDVSGRKAGESFSCSCGNVLGVPKKSNTGLIVGIVIAVCAVPCVLGVLAAIAIPNFIKYQMRSKAMEARMNVRAIATAEMAHFGEKGEYVPAGPVPAKVPGSQRVPFVADQGFQQLAWTTEGVRYQYEVRVLEPRRAVVIARGDLDGNGVFSEFKVELEDGNPPGPVQASNELE
jgi:type IV pilus assembly protein PilA